MMLNAPQICNVISTFIGILDLYYTDKPIGDCSLCCQFNDAVDIKYLLYTPLNPSVAQLLVPGNNTTALNNSNFDPARPTVIFLTGFTEAVNGASGTTMRNAHLSTGSYNYIAVDWSRLIAFPWYATAVRNTRHMGERLADFVEFLILNTRVTPSDIHIIGFSLGAEASGFAGKALKARGIHLARITGLDPAYPGYALNNNDGHLAKGDAVFVDIVHTNPGVFGFPNAIGDVDFYPNPGASFQPGCWIDQLKFIKPDMMLGCSHKRAWMYYAESLHNPKGFPATKCSNWTLPPMGCVFRTDGYMGIGAQPPMSGKMYLRTNAESPYARNGP